MASLLPLRLVNLRYPRVLFETVNIRFLHACTVYHLAGLMGGARAGSGPAAGLQAHRSAAASDSPAV